MASRARAATADAALALFESGGSKSRMQALEDILFIFGKQSNITNISVLEKDKTYHRALEALFHCVISEKQAYYGSKKPSNTSGGGKSNLAASASKSPKLTKCAEALRTVVERGVATLKKKTVSAVIDHITQTLHGPADELVHPLLQDYLKALACILGHGPHVETLAAHDSEGWATCTDFVVQIIGQYVESGDQDQTTSRASPAPGPMSTTFSLAVSNLRSKSTSSSQHNGAQLRASDLQYLVLCLHSLVTTSNAPIRQRSKAIVTTVVQVLRMPVNFGVVHQLSFSILNTLLIFCQTDDVELAKSMSSDLVPLINRWWQARVSSRDDDALRNSVQAEILKTLHNMHIPLDEIVRGGATSVQSDLEELCDTFWSEYTRRDTRAQLSQDDLTYSIVSQHAYGFSTGLFGLRLNNVDGERRWAFIHVLSILESILWRNAQSAPPTANDDEQPRKKRRTEEGVGRFLCKLHSVDSSVQFTALQIVPFLPLETGPLATNQDALLFVVSNLASHKTVRLAVWAMISTASLAYTAVEGEIPSDNKKVWKQMWRLATRALSTTTHCRAASILLYSILSNDLIAYHEVAEDINTIVTTADVSGPAIAVDSSLVLMSQLLQLRNYHAPSASHATSNHVVRWLFLRWDPADISFVSSHSANTAPLDIINLLRLSYGVQPIALSSLVQTMNGPIGENWSEVNNRRAIVEYLLLHNDMSSTPFWQRRQKDSQSGMVYQAGETPDSQAIKALVAELLHPKLQEAESLCESWSLRGDGYSQVTSEKLRSLITCLIVAAVTLPHTKQAKARQSQDMEPILSHILGASLKAASESSESQTLHEVVLQSIRPYLPVCTISGLTAFFRDMSDLGSTFSELSQIFRERSGKHMSEKHEDAMDLDDEFESQHSRASTTSAVAEIPRHEFACLDSGAFFWDTIQRLHFLSIMHLDTQKIGWVPSEFLNDFLACSDEDILSCRKFSKELFSGDLIITPSDASSVIEKLGGIIAKSSYSSSEVAIICCIDAMCGFMKIWSDGQSGLSGPVSDLYSFLVQRAWPNNLLSTKAQIALSQLMFDLTQVNEKYPEYLELPMTVTSLLALLQQGTMRVKFSIGSGLSNIFKRYVLKTHDSVFVDVLGSLPTDPGIAEGIALRLFVLGELAQRWPTLLRRCIYHIFETPGNIRYSLKHATVCLEKVATKLKLDSPRLFFQLFAPQLLYTWLEDEQASIDTVPFEIFGFGSLSELLIDAQSEVAALMFMRGQDTAATDLASSLNLTMVQLMQQSFAKIMAYSFAHDIDAKKGEQNEETRIRKLMGREAYLESIYINFADIIAIFFTLIDQEDPIEKSWAKDEEFRSAAAAMAEMKRLGHSEVELLANQQPSFRAKHLVRQIAVLCSRTKHEASTLWTPALVVAVARRLFNMIHPALGSLHACSVIRKVRVLVCLANSSALESYALEMLLHSIRPWMVDSECADDALGLSQYLLVHGSSSLSKMPSFLAGYALSTLASLRVFLESSQASTTQESQFKATMTKAQKFHSWFAKYLEAYKPTIQQSDDQLSSFKAITRSAARVRSSGNSERGTHESNLLLEILNDGRGETSLLNEPSRRLAFELLCKDFRLPDALQDDAINSDAEALDLATAVWASSQSGSIDSQDDRYLVWAGRVVGRSFAASGTVDQALLRESSLGRRFDTSSESSNSHQGLLELLQSLTADSDSFTAGLAESALRIVVTEAAAQEDRDLSAACRQVLTDQLLASSDWAQYQPPPSDNILVQGVPEAGALSKEAFCSPRWAQQLTRYLCQAVRGNIILGAVAPILAHVAGFSQRAFPLIAHLVLLAENNKQHAVKRNLSRALKEWLDPSVDLNKENLRLVVNTLLYLRSQKLPGEHSIADRAQWLDVDLSIAGAAAARCGMYKTALLLIESKVVESSRSSRRSSATKADDNTDILLEIYENIDDPDAYYGIPSSPTLSSVVARLEYEKDGIQSLAFRGAQFNSHLRSKDSASALDNVSLLSTLNSLGLSGLSHSLSQSQPNVDAVAVAVDKTFDNARRLEIWNLPAPASTSNSSVALYKAYQGCYQATEFQAAREAVHQSLGYVMRKVSTKGLLGTASIRQYLGCLAALSELDDVLNVIDAADLDQVLAMFEDRSEWMRSGRLDDVRHMLSCRETTLSMLGRSLQMRTVAQITPSSTKLVEVKSMLISSGVYRFHEATQESLNIATALNDLIVSTQDLELTIDAAARLEAANSLWDHGEMIPSIRMLQSIDNDSDLKKQSVVINRSDLLAKIGHQASVARLEKPDSIQRNYLQAALNELKGKATGPEAGEVYHQFAKFCDEQLQNPDGLEDLARLQHLRRGKNDEVMQLKELISNTKESQMKSRYAGHLARAKQWLELDDQDLRRVEQSRSEFVRLSLENYLLSLEASDEHNSDSLRFTALWLERSDEDFANEAVKKYITKVPTRKFASLMNQLTSRLLEQSNNFQKTLMDLVYRICVDHPYHGMYQLWSGSKSKVNSKDDGAISRQKATKIIGAKLSKTDTISAVWHSLDRTSRVYHSLAMERDQRYKQGSKIALSDSPMGAELIKAFAKYPIPPPTMQIELSASRDYSGVPSIVRTEPTMTIASGVSAPKIVTLVGSDGKRYKQLVKGGTDDLRQDAIMEQVFAAVSDVLKLHRSTQQRNLGIRTYKVLPLTSTSGLIEFVSNTIPLHEYLMPAHERYHPKDLKGSACRKEISAVQSKSVDARLAAYRKVTEKFQPVMRYFFMEYFVDPDEWYARRTAYTRASAAISMLGHVLGLGDRHGHNILLDHQTGEVVHIDLGVAFEMGRVLPVPEIVPFRLTRDIVDGMGITKTEGVFRRCCEFTLDALRKETYSIMTILDVLRYDPLYSWSISPVRLAKLQDTRRDGEDAGAAEGELDADIRKGKKGNGNGGGGANEPSEADRALEVVRKKLSKTLSVTAMVNDLINQAVDERNLAVLYSGWAAYA